MRFINEENLGEVYDIPYTEADPVAEPPVAKAAQAPELPPAEQPAVPAAHNGPAPHFKHTDKLKSPHTNGRQVG